MSKVIGVMGESGAGKTTSLRNLDPKKTFYIDSDKGNLVPEEEMYERGEPKHIIEELDMKHLCYEKQAMFGHFYE